MEFSEGGGISISESFEISGPDAMREMMEGDNRFGVANVTTLFSHKSSIDVNVLHLESASLGHLTHHLICLLIATVASGSAGAGQGEGGFAQLMGF